MSILIKGMEMPKDCRECKMLTYYSTSGCSMCDITGNALARNFKPIPFDGRPDWCPLVEIPEPHGRLIDESNVKDAIYERLKVLQTHEVFRRKRGDIDLLGVLPYIDKIPTVIAREDGEDNA